MSDNELGTFDETLEDTYKFLKDLEDRLGWTGRRSQTFRLVRSVFHALRDRLPVNEAVQFGADLPSLLRGYYYEGWIAADKPIKMNKEEFIKRIHKEFNFSTDLSTEQLVSTVMESLGRFISKDEKEDIKAVLPKDISPMIR